MADSDNKKITQLTRVTSLNDSDLFVVTIDPGTSPLTRAIAKSDTFSSTAWTPVLVGTTAAGAGTYTSQKGMYSKIGSMVFIQAYMVWTAHTGTGNMRIGGLPFTPSTTANVFQPFAVWFSNLTLSAVGNKVQVYASPLQSQLNVEEVAGGASAALALDTTGSLMISGFYFVD